MDRGLLIVISGPSGAGKGTVVSRIREMDGDIELSVSVTTRKPRPGEVDGINYHFCTMAEVRKMIENGEFLEYMEVFGNCYGTGKRFVEEKLNSGKNVILEIDTKGALAVKNIMPDAVLIFILPPSMEVLRSRLVGRNTESSDEIDRRFGEALDEIAKAYDYDYAVVNDTVDKCARDILDIVRVEHYKVARSGELLGKYK